MMNISKVINDNLIWFILLAVIMGVFLPQFSFLANYVSVMLFFMILGLGFTLKFSRFKEVLKKPWKIVLAIATIYTIIPGIGYLLSLFVSNMQHSDGILIIGSAPSEITSALMVYLSGGNLAFGTVIMGFSILLAPFLMPFILSLAGQSVNIDVLNMFVTLLIIVALPMLLGSFFRTKFSKLQKYENEFSSVSSVMVILLIFVVASANSSAILDVSIISLVLIMLLFNILNYGVGFTIGKLFKVKEFKSFIFSIGMKEFGVATAVALQFFSSQAALPAAVYGIIMLITSPILAKFLKK